LFTSNEFPYWTKGLKQQNFGDFLTEVFFNAFSRPTLFDRKAGRKSGNYDVMHLVGSVISDWHIRADLEHARGGGPQKVAFWGCGMRGVEQLDAELSQHCVFLGARGPLTRDQLQLPRETPLGDPALLLPLLHRARSETEYRDACVCVPHFLDPRSDQQILSLTGADKVLRPMMFAGLESAYKFIDQLMSARFALCGALHAAVVRCAYGSSFGYFDSGIVDVPFKWDDFALSIGIPTRFSQTTSESQTIYESEIAEKIVLPPLMPLLSCSPLTPPRALVERALAHDKRARASTRRV
jgi:hypothetical protein